MSKSVRPILLAALLVAGAPAAAGTVEQKQTSEQAVERLLEERGTNGVPAGDMPVANQPDHDVGEAAGTVISDDPVAVDPGIAASPGDDAETGAEAPKPERGTDAGTIRD